MNRLSGITALVMGALSITAANAAELQHAVGTSICRLSNEAHSRCVSSHTDGNIFDTNRLAFLCRMTRNTVKTAEVKHLYSELASDGRYSAQLDTPLSPGSGVVYCGYNLSRYVNAFGVVLLGQGTAEHCIIYSVSSGDPGGGPEIP